MFAKDQLCCMRWAYLRQFKTFGNGIADIELEVEILCYISSQSLSICQYMPIQLQRHFTDIIGHLASDNLISFEFWLRNLWSPSNGACPIQVFKGKTIRRLVPTQESECRSCVLSGPDHHWSFETTYHAQLLLLADVILQARFSVSHVPAQSQGVSGMERTCTILAWTTEEVAANLLEYHAEHARIMLHNRSFTRIMFKFST